MAHLAQRVSGESHAEAHLSEAMSKPPLELVRNSASCQNEPHLRPQLVKGRLPNDPPPKKGPTLRTFYCIAAMVPAAIPFCRKTAFSAL
jgi:hypothetical protein